MKNVIFDFDGTLADTIDSGMEIINSFAPRYGFRAVSKSDRERLRDLPSREILKTKPFVQWIQLPRASVFEFTSFDAWSESKNLTQRREGAERHRIQKWGASTV